MESNNTNKVDCFQCKYFAVTWEPRFPRSCKLFGFKTVQMPSVTVFNSSGVQCEGFVKKEKNEDI